MRQRYPLHIFLFLVTVFTTLMAGAEAATARFFIDRSLNWSELWRGIPFSLSFLAFLTVHEFGHYFTAVYHRVRCTLPYYIPIFIPGAPINIGSFGAVIRIREVPSSRRKYFDIGVAGPLAGFVVAIGILLYGFTHLPPVQETILEIHPGFVSDFGGIPSEAAMADAQGVVRYGGSLLFEGLMWLFRNDPNMPPSFEMQHYPFLLVGFLTLFFTALNLLPIGQLDGGHVMYGLFGARRASMISRVAVFGLLLMGGVGVFTLQDIQTLGMPMPWYERLGEVGVMLLYVGCVYYILRHLSKQWDRKWSMVATAVVLGVQFGIAWAANVQMPNLIWLIYALMAVRLIGLDHPIAPDDTPLTTRQKILGWLAILIFLLCFSPNPIELT